MGKVNQEGEGERGERTARGYGWSHLGLVKKEESVLDPWASFASFAFLVACAEALAFIAGVCLGGGVGRFCAELESVTHAGAAARGGDGTAAAEESDDILRAALSLTSHASATYSPNNPAA